MTDDKDALIKRITKERDDALDNLKIQTLRADHFVWERDEAREHIEALSQAAKCACPYDNPDDACLS